MSTTGELHLRIARGGELSTLATGGHVCTTHVPTGRHLTAPAHD